MNGYRISNLCCKMPTVGLPCRTRSLKPSFRLTRIDWIKQEVESIHEPDSPLSVDLNFLQRKKARFLLHSASRAELRNLCVAAVVALCLVLRQRQLLLLLPLPLPTHLLGSKMRKGTLYVGSFVIL